MRIAIFVLLTILLAACGETSVTTSGGPDGDVEVDASDGDDESGIDAPTDGDMTVDGDEVEMNENQICEPNARWCEGTELHACNDDGTDEFIPEDCGSIGCENAECVEEYALEFDADTAHVLLGEHDLANQSAITIEFWLKPTAASKHQRVFFDVSRIALDITPRHTVKWYRKLPDDTQYFTVETLPNSVHAGEWVHVAVVAADVTEIFINGLSAAKTESPGEYSALSVTGLQLGILADHETEYLQSFNGVIDEVRVSDTVRYTEDFTPAYRYESDANTIGLWHFDKGEGAVVKDASGNDYDGAMQEGVSWTGDAVWRNWLCTPQWGQCLPESTERKICDEDGLGWNEPTDCGPIGCKNGECIKEYALGFDGEDGWVDLGERWLVSDKETATVELWLRWGGMINEDQNQIVYVEGDEINWNIAIKPSGIIGFGERSGPLQTTPWFSFFSQTQIDAGDWHHIAVTKDSGIYNLYIDGHHEISSYNENYSLESWQAPRTYLGRCIVPYFGEYRWFHGIIDELRVSDIIRYSEDFTPVYHYESDEHTLGLWHFDSGIGEKAYDAGGKYHGDIHDGASWTDQAVWRNWECPSGWMSCADDTTLNRCNASGRWVEEQICNNDMTCVSESPSVAACVEVQ